MIPLYIKALSASDWTALPVPTAYSVTVSDLDASNAGRDQSGLMHRDRIAVKRKIKATWSKPSAATVQSILGATSAIFFNLRYVDPMTNTQRDGTFYVGDRSLDMASLYNDMAVYDSLELSMPER